jgi:hypothetical protein
MASLFPSRTLAQKRHSSKLSDDIDLPADYSLDFKLGASARSSIRGSNALLVGAPLNKVGLEVLHNLISTASVASLARPYQWNLSVVDNNVLNAQSSPDGEIFVHGGLAQLIGTNRGLWAAVLSHETEHTAQRHWVKKYLYNAYVTALMEYWQERARLGDKSANWVLLGLRISAPIAAAKLSRSLEHDADIKGMMLMAEAGYHPDYVFALHHMLLLHSSDQSHFAAFFSTHPRWETRDQRDDKAYAEAVSAYNRRWPDPLSSPGGLAPDVVFTGKPEARENKQAGTADLELPLYCRNASEPLHLVIHFSKDSQPLHAEADEYRDSAGNLEFRQEIICTDKEDSSRLAVHLPANVVSEKNRKTTAQIDVVNPTGETLGRFTALDVHFPKANGKVTNPNLASRAPTALPASSSPASVEKRVPTALVQPELKAVAPEIQTPTPAQEAKTVALSSISPSELVASKTSLQETSTMNPEPRAETQCSVGPKSLGWIGVNTRDDDAGNVIIARLAPNSPATRAGLQLGDIIVQLNGAPVQSGERFYVAISRYSPGCAILLSYTRGASHSEAKLLVEREF